MVTDLLLYAMMKGEGAKEEDSNKASVDKEKQWLDLGSRKLFTVTPTVLEMV